MQMHYWGLGLKPSPWVQDMSTPQTAQTSVSDVRPVSGPAGLENVIGAVRAMVDTFLTLYPQSRYEIEYAEDAVIATITTKGFDFVMLSEIQRIARTYNVKIGFNVEPFDHDFVNVFLVVGEVCSE